MTSRPPAKARRKRVLLLITSWHGYQRSVMRGIADYARRHGPWDFEVPSEPPPAEELRQAGFDGVLYELWHHAYRTLAAATGAPTVGVLGAVDDVCDAAVSDDDPGIVAMAIAHLRELGLSQFAYADVPWTLSPRQEAFRAAMEAAGEPVRVFPPRPYRREPPARMRQDLRAWVRALPRPIGIFCHDTDNAREVAAACAHAGVLVPEEAAVLGFGGDELTCNLAAPSLSVVDGGGERIGYEAARRLDLLMHGRPVEPKFVTVPPIGVARRQSTDTLAVADPDVAAAVRFIRDNACEGLRVADVLRHVPVSRRVLEYAFRQALGRTIYQEILRVQLEHAKHLLVRTDLAMPQVCARCGFSAPSRLSVVFKRHVGLSPRQFRMTQRAGAVR